MTDEEAIKMSNGGGAARRTRNTQQRKAVLAAVRALNGRHPSAADIFTEVRRDHPQMSLATVYRALHALVEQNELMEMRVENVARYDAGPCAHHHLVCRRCGTVVDVCSDTLPAIALRQIGRHLEKSSDFALDLHPIQFSGVCRTCRS